MLKAASPTGPGLGLAEQPPVSSARPGAPGGQGRAHPHNAPGTRCPNWPEAGPTSSGPGWPSYAGQQGRLDGRGQGCEVTAPHGPPPTPAGPKHPTSRAGISAFSQNVRPHQQQCRPPSLPTAGRDPH